MRVLAWLADRRPAGNSRRRAPGSGHGEELSLWSPFRSQSEDRNYFRVGMPDITPCPIFPLGCQKSSIREQWSHQLLSKQALPE